LRAWKEAFARFGFRLSLHELALNAGRSYKETLDVFVSGGKGKKLSQRESALLRLEKNKRFERYYRGKIFPGVLSFLRFLREQGIRTALVTGAHNRLARRMVREHFKGLFDVVVGSDDTTQGKPDPAPYRLALKKLGIRASEGVVIEDALLGIESAKRARIEAFALTTTLPRRYFTHADKVFSSHKRLFLYLKRYLVRI